MRLTLFVMSGLCEADLTPDFSLRIAAILLGPACLDGQDPMVVTVFCCYLITEVSNLVYMFKKNHYIDSTE